MKDAPFAFDSLFLPEGRDQVNFPELAKSYYHAVTASILETAVRSGHAIDGEHFRLEDKLLNDNGTDCWAPELGYAFQLARQEGRLVANALAQLALYNARLGKTQDLQFEPARGSYLIVAGITIGSAGFMELHSDGRIIEVKTENIELKFEKKSGFWDCSSHPEAWRRHVPGTNITVTGGNCLDPELVYSLDPPGKSDQFEDAVSEIALAMSLIMERVPRYGPWCERFLRQIHVVGKNKDISFSRSAPSRPGYVVASAPMPIELQAEMLVHECTHQYYFLLELLTPIPMNRDSKEKFYSPLAKRERPLERLLVAYHAAANMVLFHTELLRNYREHADVSHERLAVLKPAALELIETISQNERHLTTNANAFWRPSRSLIEGLCRAA